MGTGALWRDLPPGLGKWNSQLRRFQRWANSRVLQRLFQALSGHPDLESVLIVGTPIGFLLLPGQTHHSKGVTPWITSVPFGALLVGKALGTDWLLTALDARGATTGIPPRAGHHHQRTYPKEASSGAP